MAQFQKDGLWVQGGQGALANVNESTPFVAGQLGRVLTIRSTDGKVPRFYQYVKTTATTTAALAAGHPAYWCDYDDFIVTPDSASAIGTTPNPVFAGVFLGTSPAKGNYGFIGVGGPQTLSVADTNTLLGGELLLAIGTQFKTTPVTTTEWVTSILQRPAAIALAAAASATTATVIGLLNAPHLGW